jgi:DNA primase catalytic core, N-terminal domain
MSLIQAALQAILPPNRKPTPSGWISFDAPCCHHRGESRDDRKRGGIMITGDAFSFHCFNCNFKAGWSPGKLLSKNTKNLFTWLGMPDSEIQKLSLEALREHDDQPKVKKQFSFELEERPLPNNCRKFIDVVNPSDDFLNTVEYIINRGMKLDWYDWMWSDENGYRDRVIIPFYQDNKIVGYTGRKITEGKPKYLTTVQPGYVFNLTAQNKNRRYIIVTEGQFDAIAIDGVAIGHNDPNEVQIARLNATGREIIVVPDRDRPGAQLLKSAIDNGWSASLPPWGDDIKDVADAVKRYGRLYTLAAILHYRDTNQIKIQLLKKKLEKLNG